MLSYQYRKSHFGDKTRVAIGQGKIIEKNIFLRSVKSQWILWEVSEKLDLSKSLWKVNEFETALVLATLKTVVRLSYLHSRITYTGKMASLYGINPQMHFQSPFTVIYQVKFGLG